MRRIMADLHDLLAVEQFLAAESRVEGTFARVEEAVAPLLRRMRATGRITYAVDAERGALWGHAFLRPPYAPADPAAEWFIAWGLRFPDGGSGWNGAEPPLPRGIQAVVALGAAGTPCDRAAVAQARGMRLSGWSALPGDAAFLAVARPLDAFPPDGDGLADVLSGWVLARLQELESALPALAAG